MHYNSMGEMLENIREFVKNNPDAYIQVKNYYRELRWGFSAWVGNDEEPSVEWTIGLGQSKNHDGALSDNEYEILKKYFVTKADANDAETKYIDMITRRNKTPEMDDATLDKMAKKVVALNEFLKTQE